MATKKLGSLLCEKSYLDEDQLDRALTQQQHKHRPLGQILLELGFISQIQLNEALAHQAGIARLDLSELSLGQQTISLVPAEMVTRYNVIPVGQNNGRLDVAMADPFNTQAIEDLRVVTGLSVGRYYADPHDLEQAVTRFYGSNIARMLENLAPSESAGNGELENGDYTAAKLHELAREPSLVNLVNLILLEAIDSRASDVHIEPFEHQINIKYRIDGTL